VVIPAVSDAEQTHAELLANSGRTLVVQVRHRPDLIEAKGEPVRKQRGTGLARQPATPSVGVQMPADLDLFRSIRQRLEQD
jgi:hypothetical protein